MSLGIGLIGAGVMGADHARILDAGVPGATLASVFDADEARARAVASGSASPVASSPAALIADPRVEAVLVASPDETHADLVIACIEAGKPVLCEKPLASTLQGCRRIVEAEMRAGRRLVQVGYMRRFDAGYRAMRDSLRSGAFGAPLFLHCIHRNAVAPHFITSDLVIANAAVHEIDIGRFLLDEDFAAATVVSPRASALAPSRRPQLVVLETAGGVVVDIEAFLDAGYGYDVRAELVCESGTVSLAPEPPISTRRANLDGFRVEEDWRARFAGAYGEQMRAWVRSLQTGIPVGSSAWDGYRASLTAEACLAALRSGSRTPIEAEPVPAFYASS